MSGLKLIALAELERFVERRAAIDTDTLAAASQIVNDVHAGGDAALRRYACQHDGLGDTDALVIPRAQLIYALASLGSDARGVLERTAARITRFAEAQRASLAPLELAVAGGSAGHTIAPVERAGCYAPGGGYPLPSSVLMTAITARVAGVRSVWVASPRPTQVTMAAAALAGADSLLAAGGAHAISALAYGTASIPAVDIIVGPGNRWVTAAKKLVHGRVAIDMLAGPSELVVLADEAADPELIAADLLAQAEHASDALPIVITTTRAHAEAVNRALATQLEGLSTRELAARALENGFALVCTPDEGIAASDKLAPEHLEVMTADAHERSKRLSHYGAIFIGPGSAEVFGDYGAGPNHVLPTGGTARYTGGLSVMTFLRVRTFLRLDGTGNDRELARDAAILARLEGLEAHARAAERRAAPSAKSDM